MEQDKGIHCFNTLSFLQNDQGVDIDLGNDPLKLLGQTCSLQKNTKECLDI